MKIRKISFKIKCIAKKYFFIEKRLSKQDNRKTEN